MIRSMTAFAGGEAETPLGHLSCEMRSVNHRYLEISPRLPEALRSAEPALREQVSSALSRGKIDVNVRLKSGGAAAAGELVLNEAMAERLIALSQTLAEKIDDAAALRLGDVLTWPGVISEAEPDRAPLRQALLKLVRKVVTDLVSTREREGGALAAAITERLAQAREHTRSVQEILPEIRTAQRDRLRQRVDELAEQVDEQRFEQEIAMLLQKSDVEEELDRLLTHYDEIERVLEMEEPVGRRLDFLMQELNREANTLGSKAVDQRMTQASVELKVLIEQMREQVQNIE